LSGDNFQGVRKAIVPPKGALGAFCCFKRCCSNANNACIWTVRLVILLDVAGPPQSQ